MINFIIPVYNGEKYISRCVQSIKESCKMNFEIIIIDDGSIDNTKNICMKLSKDDNRIHYYWQKNAGVSAARNKGIDVSSGDWIMFVDADDLLDFSNVVSLFDDAYDVLVFTNVNKTVRTYDFSKKDDLMEYLSGVLKISDDSNINRFYLNAVWSKAYKSKLLKDNNIRFVENIINGEDTIFNIEITKFAKNVRIYDISIYKWRVSQNSATSRYQNNLEKTDQAFLQLVKDYLCDQNMFTCFYKKYQNIVINGLWIVLYQSIGHYLNPQGTCEKAKRYNLLSSVSPYKDAICDLNKGIIKVKKERFLVFKLLELKLYMPAFWLIKYSTKKKKMTEEHFINI